MSEAGLFIYEWIGVPHVYNGRDKTGVDCYGLVWLYYRDVLGIVLPDWNCADSSRIWVTRFIEQKIQSHLKTIDAPQDHCIAFLRRKNMASHVGVVYANGLLHCIENSSVVFQPLTIVRKIYGEFVFGVPAVETIE
jgi:cell wall-associated NlpC family hydrolase